MAGAVRRVPAIADAGINRMINGPEGFTPDNEFILGESEVRGFFVAAGFCAHGIAGAGGIGRQVASWIVDGEPELDLWKMDIRRFGPAVPQPGLHARPLDRELRDLLRHPLPERGAPGRSAAAHLADVRRSSTGSARPSARSPAGSARTGSSRTPPPATRRFGRAAGPASTGRRRSAPRRSRRGRRPACSTRRGSPRSRSSGRARSRSCSGCARTTSTCRSARIVYTQLLNRRGGIECDLTVTRRHRRPLPDRHRDRGRATTISAGCAGTCPTTAACSSTT